MKKILILTAGISSIMMFSQEIVLSRFDLLGGTFINSVNSSTGRSIKYDEISGSPYIDKNFRDAKIAESYQNAPVRYNSYKDELEFKNNDEIMILPKESKFERVEITSPKQVFVYKSLDSEPTGYYIELVVGEFSLYKKLKTNFVDISPAKTPYGSDKPAYFSAVAPVYYIVANGRTMKKPKNQKQITDLLPNRKEAINSFVKENKIKFDGEEDLKKLVLFLNNN